MNISLSTHFIARIKAGQIDRFYDDDTLTRIITHDGSIYYYNLPAINSAELKTAILNAFDEDNVEIEKYGASSFKVWIGI